MLGRLSLTHVLLFIVVLLLLFGARRLPEIGGAMGKSIRAFKRGIREGQDGIERPAASDDQPKAAPPKDVSRTN